MIKLSRRPDPAGCDSRIKIFARVYFSCHTVTLSQIDADVSISREGYNYETVSALRRAKHRLWLADKRHTFGS